MLRAFEGHEAVPHLLKRFELVLDHGLQDSSEKEACMEAILRWGDAALPAVMDAVRNAKRIAWPLKMLERLKSIEDYFNDLIELLGGAFVSFDEAVQERHTEVLLALKEISDERALPKVTEFVKSRDEGVRMAALECLEAIAIHSETAKQLLISMAQNEVSDDNSRFLGQVKSIVNRQGWAPAAAPVTP